MFLSGFDDNKRYLKVCCRLNAEIWHSLLSDHVISSAHHIVHS